MSKNRIEFNGGVDELKAGLLKMTPEMAGEAVPIVFGSANGAKVEIVATYPARTGNLRRRVYVTQRSGEFSATAVVKNPAPHASIFENGTQARHNALGANRGSMPAGHVFVPAVIRWRRTMYARLKALLERHGLLVTGDAG